MAKKELAEINQRLNQKVKWTFTRPSNASKISSKIIQIKEKNREELQITENEDNKTISGVPSSGHKTEKCEIIVEDHEKNNTKSTIVKTIEAPQIRGT